MKLKIPDVAGIDQSIKKSIIYPKSNMPKKPVQYLQTVKVRNIENDQSFLSEMSFIRHYKIGPNNQSQISTKIKDYYKTFYRGGISTKFSTLVLSDLTFLVNYDCQNNHIKKKKNFDVALDRIEKSDLKEDQKDYLIEVISFPVPKGDKQTNNNCSEKNIGPIAKKSLIGKKPGDIWEETGVLGVSPTKIEFIGWKRDGDKIEAVFSGQSNEEKTNQSGDTFSAHIDFLLYISEDWKSNRVISLANVDLKSKKNTLSKQMLVSIEIKPF